MSQPNHYVTHSGGPPHGGIPPGSGRFAAPSPTPPPSYTSAISNGPPNGGIPQGSFRPPATVPPSPHTYRLAIVHTPITPPARTDVPIRRGSSLKGESVTFGDGIGYIFPQNHTIFHIVTGNHLPWECPGARFRFSVFRTPTLITIQELIEQASTESDDNPARGITECIEVGDGSWRRGSSFTLNDDPDRLKQTIKSLGWDESRGTIAKPVLLALH
ncbi:hypothetical protein MMC06_000989 [Schaereria dolodes]|nr:hypothetical protein [Schaereria dolodes]